ncbi:MAG: hypothetical protein SCALA702_05260 [Melioribacteraceae bacterium]|nr:MAG: hypothetical protein SCALA702_05260 [Melioribacteraceae bacterium]
MKDLFNPAIFNTNFPHILFEDSPIGIFLFDHEGIIQNCNAKFCEITGSDKSKIIGLNTLKDIKDQDVISSVEESLKTGSARVEKNYTSVTGNKTTPVILELKAIYDEDSNISGGIGYVQDVTPKYEISDKFDRVELSFRGVLNNLPMFGLVLAPDGKILEINSYFHKYFKDLEIPIEGLDFFETFLRENDRKLARKYFYSCVKDGSKYSDNIFELIKNENESKIVSWVITPRYNHKDELEGIVCIGEDVTERVKYTFEKLENERRLKHALSGSGQGVWEIDFIEKKLYLDETFLRLLELPISNPEFSLADIKSLIHADDIRNVIGLFKEFRSGKKDVFEIDLRVYQAGSRNYKWAMLTGSVMESDHLNRATRVIGTQVDIDSKKLEGKYLEIERDFALFINQSVSLDNLLKQSLHSILKLADTVSGGIYLRNEDNSLSLKYHAGLNEKFIENVKFYAANETQAQLVNKGDVVFKAFDVPPEVYESEKIIGVAVFPLVKDGVAYGAINLGFKSLKKYEMANRTRLENFALVITGAISKVVAEEKLTRSEEKYKNFIRQTTDAIVCIEFNPEVSKSRDVNEQLSKLCSGKLVDVNEAFLNIFQFRSRDSVLGKDVKDVFPATSSHCDILFREFIYRNYKLTDYEYSFQTDESDEIHTIVNFDCFSREDKLYQLWITFKDITRIKSAELALVASENKYSTVVENASEIILVHINGVVKFVNRAALLHTGFEFDEIINSNILDFVHPDDHDIVLKNIADRQGNKITVNPYVVRLLKKEGGWFFGEIFGRIIEYEKRPAFLVFIQDVTKKIENERKLKESEENYRLLTETSYDGIAKVNRKGIFTFTNKSNADISGYRVDEILGKNILDLIPEEEREANLRILNIVFAGSSFNGEGSILTKTGDIVPVSFSMAPITKGHSGIDDAVIIVRDITKRKKYEIELKENEARLRKLFEQIPAIVWTTDSRGILTSVAGSALNKNEIDTHSILQNEFSQAIENYVGEDQYSKYAETLASGKTYSREESIQGRVFDIVADPLKDEQGTIIGAIGIALDVTERRKAEEKLNQLSAAVEQSATSIVITDLDGKIEYVNNKFVEVTGYSKQEVLSKNPNVLKSGEMSSENYARLWAKISNGEEWNGEFHNKRKNGEMFWERAVISPIKNKTGEITHYLAVKEDITQFKKVQEELANYRNHLEDLVAERTSLLRLTEERFRKLAEYSKDIILRFTLTGDIIYYNPALSGFIAESETIVINHIRDLTLSEKLQKEFDTAISDVADIKTQLVKEMNFPADYWFEWTFIPELDDEKNVENVIAFAHDITERMKVEEKMRKALSAEKELNKLKSNFISMASHEFRTPLTAILASADLLEMFGRSWDENKFAEHTAKIQNAVEEMTVLLDEVLTLSRYESGKTMFNPSEADIIKFTEDVIETARLSDLCDHNISTKFDLETKYHKFDSRLLTQIMTNLLTNAFKYSERNTNVFIELSESDENLIFKVKDEGLGIPFEEQKHIFDPFFRGTDVQEIVGTGLGLSIVSESVKQHNGFIKFHSELGAGSEFIVYLLKSYE